MRASCQPRRPIRLASFSTSDPMKLIRYLQTWFEVDMHGTSQAKFTAGCIYPITDESARHVELGIAEHIDAPEDLDKAVAAAEKAEAAAAKATEAADAARQTATVAQAAADIKG